MSRTIEPAGTGTPLGPASVVVFDYPGRRAEARISDLGLSDHGVLLDHLLEPSRLPREVTARAYTTALVTSEPQRAGGDRVAAVLAYCAATAMGREYADLVEESGEERPPLVCFDAGPVTLEDVENAYTAALRQVSGGSQADSSPPIPVASLLDDPLRLTDAVRKDLTERAFRSLAADGLAASDVAGPVDQMVETNISWLTHLLAARDTTPRQPRGVILNVLSRDHTDQAEWLAGQDVRTVRIDCPRADLLCHPGTRSAVLSFLTEISGGPVQPTSGR
ncbi:hypothetical protein ACIGXI_23020 [Kitasatospora aureofaciens]|uniref:hypothetical protein n=1 Tax=Kitasatospora aureofaciens TaxID=1894 RepID=UPI0037CA08D2